MATRRARISMRWWLALVFAGIAALTALIVAQVFRSSSESAIRDRAAELTAGTAVAAAARIAGAETPGDAATIAAETAGRRQVALFVFARDGGLISPSRSAGVALDDVPELERGLDEALSGRRFVETDAGSGSITVGLPIRGSDQAAALVAFASRPDLEDALGIVQDEILSAALRATLAGAVVGLVVALLITHRLRRIAAAAAAIEEGRFEGSLSARFPDELGELAGTVDQMRERLAESFSNLEAERDRLHRLLEQLQEAVVAVDPELEIVFANSKARLLLGTETRAGYPLPEPWPGVSLRDATAGLFADRARSFSLAIRPTPETSLMLAGLPPSFGSQTAVLVITDVTLRERRERAEREFVANAAHELRTPLTAIASAVEVLQEGAKHDPGERDRFLGVVGRQTDRLTGLVGALLTLARAQTDAGAVTLEQVDLAPLFEEVVADALDRGRAIDADPPDGLRVRAHRDLLHQALANLVDNAFTHGEGRQVRLTAHAVGREWVVISVSDKGPGMGEAQRARALERFSRGDNGQRGYGLGLAIAREVARALTGELSIDSAPGAGTTVSLRLESCGPERMGAP